MPSCIWYSAHKHVIAASFFPCELYAFSNYYTFRLRIYKLQYEQAHGEVPVGGETAEGSSPALSEPSSASSAAEPGSSVVASAKHPAKRDITTPEQYANEGHELAARAVAAVGDVGQPDFYSPVAPLSSSIPSPQTSLMPTLTSSILTSAASLTASVAYSTLTAIHQNAAEAAVNSTSSSEASSTGGEVELTPEEQTFIYKTFLITGGLIMTINSFIKLLNTKVHGEFRRLLFLFCLLVYLIHIRLLTYFSAKDIYGKIIILCRILNAIVLWSMCALPFTQLSALLLISVMTGSLILQALIDLLD